MSNSCVGCDGWAEIQITRLQDAAEGEFNEAAVTFLKTVITSHHVHLTSHPLTKTHHYALFQSSSSIDTDWMSVAGPKNRLFFLPAKRRHSNLINTPPLSKILAKCIYTILFSVIQHQRRALSTVKQTTKYDYFYAVFVQIKDKHIPYIQTVCRPANEAKGDQSSLFSMLVHKPTIWFWYSETRSEVVMG